MKGKGTRQFIAERKDGTINVFRQRVDNSNTYDHKVAEKTYLVTTRLVANQAGQPLRIK